MPRHVPRRASRPEPASHASRPERRRHLAAAAPVHIRRISARPLHGPPPLDISALRIPPLRREAGMGLPVRRHRRFPDDRDLVVLSGGSAASALRLSVSLHDHGSGRTARRETGDIRRGEGDPDLSRRRNRDGDLQDPGRLVDLPGAEFLPRRWRAAVLRLHVCLHRQLSLPRVAAVRFRVFPSSAAPRPGRAQRCDLSQFLQPSLHRRSALAAVCLGRLAVLPHPRLFQGLA